LGVVKAVRCWLNDESAAFDLIRQAQHVLDHIEALRIPTVAMIDGFCLGGGCELTLACRYRVASLESNTRIGLPEVKLGIHPGWGGTVRLPLLIGPSKAMSIMLPGRAISARAAKKIGMIDDAVPVRQLARAAHYFAMKKPKRHRPSFFEMLPNTRFLRPMMGRVMRKKLAQKVSQSHYPAPFAIVDQWVKDGGVAQDAMENEARSIAKLLMTDTSRNLVRVFFLQEQMKGLAKGQDFRAAKVHVVGAGTMGGDVAAGCALRGLRVSLQDREAKFIAPAIKRAYSLFKKKLKKSHQGFASLPMKTVSALQDRLAKIQCLV